MYLLAGHHRRLDRGVPVPTMKDKDNREAHMWRKIHTSLKSMLTFLGMAFAVPIFGFSGMVSAQDWQFVETPIGISRGVMNSMHFIDKYTGWIVGNSTQGDIIHTTNGGIDWTTQQTPVHAYLVGVFFVDANIGYAVGSEGSFGNATPVILKTENGGEQWLRQTSPVVKGGLSDVYFMSAEEGWATGTDSDTEEAVVLHTSDGATWVQSNHPVPQANLSAIAFADAHYGWIVGSTLSYPYQPIILATSNGGQNWTEQTQPLTEGNLLDVFFANPDSGWAVGKNDTSAIVLRTTNGGATWLSAVAPEGNSASSVCFLTPAHGYLAVNTWQSSSWSVAVHKTSDGGETWDQLLTSIPNAYADKVQVVRGSVHIFLLLSNILGLLQEHGQLARIDVDPANVTIQVGGMQQFTATGYDTTGTQVPVTPQWTTTGGSINPQTGLYTATTSGNFTVTASVQGSPVTGSATVHVPTTGVERYDQVATSFGLCQNYPNPFNPRTTISYSLPVQNIKSKVERGGKGTLDFELSTLYITLKVFNVMGQEVATLVDEVKEPGYYTVTWDASEMASGVYCYRLTAGRSSITRRMLILK
ncbi:MAG: T9SS C-terminal target domain-containing protein [Geobacter sp.]|nr:MAG: T9SS C-terminal target domain-containing protein [Geobacter sp.]